ncbi:MAG: hypothetical protein H6617_08880 [Bdellovibrionaceae bacterium]|nr:hypothetical protein [Bdellovibrionales bacterium]MCB9254781.1 hypothetical protein [Pseudobdellovibrionaceae bacterium]
MRGRGLFFILFFCFGLASVSEARPVRIRPFLSLDLGVLGLSIDKRFTVNPENAALASSIAGFVRLRKGWKLSNSFLLEPALGLRVPWRSGADGTVMMFTFQAELSLGWQISNFIKLRVGPGLQWDMTVGFGETVTLNNGASTSDFYAPAGFSHSFTPTGNVGLEFSFTRSVTLNFDTFVLNPIVSSRRRFNGAITIGFKL